MNRAVLVAASVLLALTVGANAATPRITQEKVIEALVRELGAERHAAREQATSALRQVGQPALAALEKAAESDDPEIRLRARDIVADLRLGIGPDWPSEIVLLIRHFDNLQEHERTGALYRIANLGPRAVPFLLRRMELGSPNEANYAFNMLQRHNNEEVWQEIIRLVKEPKNDAQARALAWARSQRGQALDPLDALAARPVPDLKLTQATEDAVQRILARLKEGKAQDALAAAEALAKAEPADPRPLYLQAEALIPLNRDKDALALRERAITLSADKEAPHYLAAKMLTALGRSRLAAKEWQRVVEIEPNDGPCDTNAYLGLSSIHAVNGLFEPAAQFLEKALQQITKADDEQAKALASALQMETQRLRQMAARYPAAPEAAIEDAIPESEIQLAIQVVPSEGSAEDFQRALAGAAAQFQIAVQPPTIALFDLTCTSLRYDKDKKQLLVLLHDQPACEPLAFDAKGADAQVAIHVPGATRFFQVEAASGKVEPLARFEKDYVVTVRPGLRLSALADPAIRINGEPYPWDKAMKGLPFDHLPEAFDVIVEGTAPLGRRITARATVEAAEPRPEPAPTPPPKAKS